MVKRALPLAFFVITNDLPPLRYHLDEFKLSCASTPSLGGNAMVRNEVRFQWTIVDLTLDGEVASDCRENTTIPSFPEGCSISEKSHIV